MSKKKFKAGLESLFGDSGDDQLPGIRPLLVEEEGQEKKRRSKKLIRPKRRSSKNFTSNLEDLFNLSFDKESKKTFEKKPISTGKNRDRTIKKRSIRPIIGIDALIRRTSVENAQTIGLNAPLKKRVTFSLEKKKLEQLKSIAKSKKSYLKDVVDEIISTYLNDYPNAQKSTN